MTTSDPNAEELAEARRRMQDILFAPSESLPARMEEFRRVLRESQHSAASRSDTTRSSLADSL